MQFPHLKKGCVEVFYVFHRDDFRKSICVHQKLQIVVSRWNAEVLICWRVMIAPKLIILIKKLC